MNFGELLAKCVARNNSLLCVGLDPDQQKLPKHLKGPDATFEFNKAIIDATADLVCAYKPNSAFYEAAGAPGIEQLKKTCDYIKQKYPNIPIILDAKRADIDNTNQGYVDFAFEYLGADAITLNPYLGGQALKPFLDRADKGAIILCRTSNSRGGEFQDLTMGDNKLYEIVAKKVKDEWNVHGNCLLVVGATQPEQLTELRELMGEDFIFLVPGIGAQGGDLQKTMRAGINQAKTGLIINAARSIIYASSGQDFAQAAQSEAKNLRDQINLIRSN